MSIQGISNTDQNSNSYFRKRDLIKSLQDNPHWRNKITNEDIHNLTLSQPYSDYIVCQGDTAHQFFIYYLTLEFLIKKEEFSLDSESQLWRFRNGYDNRMHDIKELLDYILRPH